VAKAVDRTAAEPQSLRQKTYEALKDLILTGQLKPAERISESRIAERLGVSRTPMREALMKLEKEGLVVGQRNVGYTVVAIDLNTVRDLLVVREALDAKAAELACATASDADLSRLREIIAEMERLHDTAKTEPVDAARQLELGLRIHRLIAEIARNAALSRVTDQIYQQLQMALLLELMWVDLGDLALAEHRRIADAICARDVPEAVAAACAHVRSSIENLEKILQIYTLRRSA
jgi:DNA-binding GntR family transcriptional regulator